MNEFLLQLLSLSLSGTLLILLILTLKKLYKNRLSKCWQYYIWLAAALRFFIPFAPDTTIVSTLFQTAESQLGRNFLSSTAQSGWQHSNNKDNTLNSPVSNNQSHTIISQSADQQNNAANLQPTYDKNDTDNFQNNTSLHPVPDFENASIGSIHLYTCWKKR